MRDFAKNCFLIIVFIFVFINLNFAQSQLPTRQMSQARLLFDNQEYQKALIIYYELYNDHSKHPLLNFRMAECYYGLINYNAAQKYMSNVKSLQNSLYSMPDFFLLSGKLNHRLNQFGQAVEEYQIYDSLADPEMKTNVQILIKQAQNAQKIIKEPLPFTDQNVGNPINTEFSEMAPFINYDNSILFFTSTARINDSQVIRDASRDYNESVLFSQRDANGKWSKAKPINADFAIDSSFTLHSFLPDFSAVVLSRPSLRENDKGNIYIASYNNDKFTWPERVDEPINTLAMETQASIAGDNLYFITDNERITKRPNVIARAKKSGDSWRKPGIVRGLIINHSIDYLYVHPSEKFAVFASSCTNSMGGYDLFICINNKGKWSKPVNAGYPLNSAANEIGFSISYDGKTAYVASDRNDGYGRYDIYEFNLGNYFYDRFGININTVMTSGTVKDDNGNHVECRIDIRDENGNRYRLNTDDSGNYFGLLYAGEKYSIDIRAKGYERFSDETVIDEEVTGQKKTLNFVLQTKE